MVFGVTALTGRGARPVLTCRLGAIALRMPGAETVPANLVVNTSGFGAGELDLVDRVPLGVNFVAVVEGHLDLARID